MYQAFCDQKGKVPYIPMSRRPSLWKIMRSTVCTEALGLPLAKSDTIQQDDAWSGTGLLFHGSFFLFFLPFFLFVVCFKQKALT